MQDDQRPASEEVAALDRCRALAARVTTGALATFGAPPLPEAPYASLVLVAWDARTRPLLLLSSLAEHTKNLERRAEASLLVHEAPGPDPLDVARMTLVGTCAPVPPAEADEARAAFVAAHPSAKGYASFRDFRMFRLEPRVVRWVGGFGKQAWVDFASAREKPENPPK